MINFITTIFHHIRTVFETVKGPYSVSIVCHMFKISIKDLTLCNPDSYLELTQYVLKRIQLLPPFAINLPVHH